MTQSLPLADASQVGEARRAAQAAAERLGWRAEDCGRAALVAVELASNALKHAGSGELLLNVYADAGDEGLELIALDKGPGIAGVRDAFADGFSTAGTRGEGLGAVRRQAEMVDVYTRPQQGVAVLARLAPRDPLVRDRSRPAAVEQTVSLGCVCVAKPGELVCGDSWAARLESGSVMHLMVADGLGHGPQANDASAQAVRVFDRRASEGPSESLRAIHEGLRATRGAAAAVAHIRPCEGSLSYAGVGNIAGSLIVDGQVRRMVSLNGTAGHTVSRITAFDYPFPPGRPSLTVMHSDGLGASWSLDAYPGLSHAHPSLIAAVLYRDFARRRDDVTVLVAAFTPAEAADDGVSRSDPGLMFAGDQA